MLKTAIAFLVVVLIASCSRGGRKVERNNDSSSVEENVTLNSDSRHNYPPLDFKLYMERSGSMIAFDNAATKGDFKRTVSDMLNHIPASDNDSCIYVVNDDIYRFPKGIRDFIAERDFFGATKDLGNASYTDFKKIFGLILENLGRQDVAILFSDLIYSVNNDENINAQKIMNEASAMANASFRKYPDVEVMVIKFLADYHGPYYSYNSPMKGVEYVGDRPFYAMIIASKDAMEALLNDSKYAQFRNFSTLKGYQDMFTFTNKTYSPDYTVVSSGNGKKGKYSKNRDKTEKGANAAVHSIVGATPSREGFAIPIAVDLSGIPMTATYKTDKNNYEIVSQAGYELSVIQPINPDKSKDSFGTATHILTLVAKGDVKNETIQIKMKNSMPRWIELSSSDDDTDLGASDFSRTTFSFAPMMEGVSSAILPSDDSNMYMFSLPVEIEK